MTELLRYRAAAVQYESRLGCVAENVAGLLALAERAAARGCRLIVLPEMATTGYCFSDRAEIAPLLEPLPGPSLEPFARLAARRGCYVVLGLAELDPATGAAYNSAALVGPRGLIGRVRKVHLTGRDSRWARPGDLGFPVWQTEIGRLAAHICLDACYPEAARAAALHGAEVIALPTAWDSQRAPGADWFTRAFENGVYYLVADRYGLERGSQFSGGSCILGPQGQALAHRDTGDGLVEAEIDLDCARARRWPWDEGAGDKLGERRPQFYGDLALSPWRWPLPPDRAVYDARPLPSGEAAGVAVVQLADVPASVEAARDKAAGLIAQAIREAAFPVGLVVLPELALIPGGSRALSPLLSGEGPGVRSEPIPGPTADWAAGLGREHGIFVALGLPERDGSRAYNSAILAGPGGLVGRYRKLHLTPDDRAWAEPGDEGWQTWDLPLGRVGLLIGHDALFPESARCLALRGADLILAPSAVAGPRPASVAQTAVPLKPEILREPLAGHWHLWRARAAENNCYLAFANRADEAGMGWSGLFGPDLYQYPRRESVVCGGGDRAAWLQVDTRDYPSPNAPNPARLKPLLGRRNTQFVDALLR